MNITKLKILTRRNIYNSLGFLNNISGKRKNLLTILCYHDISEDSWFFSVKYKDFENQINYLSENYQFISLGDVDKYLRGNLVLTSPSICVTFDDGYSTITKCVELLQKHTVKPAVFALSDVQNADLSEMKCGDKKFLSTSDLNYLVKCGWEIGSHGATHKDFYTLNPNEIGEEISHSKETLEDIINTEVKYFAYPKGRYTSKLIDLVKESGYKLALSMDDNVISKNSGRFNLPRVGVNGSHNLNEFKSILLPESIYTRKFTTKYFGVVDYE